MSLTESSVFECPYCMVINDVEIDAVNDIDQIQVVDCQICCQPIELHVWQGDSGIVIDARQENE